MDNLNYTQNDFEELSEWTDLSQPVFKEDSGRDAEPEAEKTEEISEKNAKKRLRSPVLTVQLILCLLVLIFMFTAKTFFYDFYSEIKAQYDEYIYATIYSDQDFSGFDFSSLFETTSDEAKL
ncbi:MAG: hypothetical protein ACI4GZ_03035 [Ruminococcus sp.]